MPLPSTWVGFRLNSTLWKVWTWPHRKCYDVKLRRSIDACGVGFQDMVLIGKQARFRLRPTSLLRCRQSDLLCLWTLNSKLATPPDETPDLNH